jgi:polysaccharide pyruvyl transferase WcaK-like protein
MTTAARRVLVVNHWHDDNRGDSAISQSILRLLHDVGPGAEVVLAGLTESGPAWERSTRLVRRAFPEVRAVPSQLPTELRGSLSRRRDFATVDADDIVATLAKLRSPATKAMLTNGSKRRRGELTERAAVWFRLTRDESAETVSL